MLSTKEKLFKACKAYLEKRINRIRLAMQDLENDLENETKSSAGDKYETGREMINLEWNKLSRQLQEFKNLENTLEMSRRSSAKNVVQLGAAVRTTTANYLISIPAGQLQVDNNTYFAIGANSPIAQLLLKKKVGEEIIFNGKKTEILEIF
ncbi:Transcription elongation factor, GreA/GreB family [Salegentibacter echinorum]|uniref:Transcription elongation factor, GreA/GreB family n=1 Tax=Salegentibacter echinorum TaxID=1073325 RepID=A0A1M5INS0_SALEC|nr:transcription elongation factor [Salegentibacter echinorum]SHG29891.1 Transcription elongation factor, GreA/GreB family [Salegentibacter echinorum]